MTDYLTIKMGIDYECEASGMKDKAAIEEESELNWRAYQLVEKEPGERVLMHMESGKTAKDYINTTLRTLRPHRWERPVEVDMVEAAFGSAPTMHARAALFQEVGKRTYDRLMKEWGASPTNLRPGRNPTKEAGEAKKAASTNPSNPWSSCAENCDARTGRYTANALSRQGSIVKSLGAAKAAQMAASAGAFLGASSPRARQLAPRT